MNSEVSTQKQDGKIDQTTPGTASTSSPSMPALIPPVDIYENDKGITVLADLPGVTRDQLGIHIDGDSLVIEATASAPAPADMRMSYSEVDSASYRRAFTLSRELDVTKIDAKLKDGVLTLLIPRSEEAKPRKIDVKVA
ncbi:MAG: Hsp20/alpha crystallin family protein [Burkholderiaceae bacterium]